MDTLQMLSKMCHDTLSAADIKAVCKNRGFSAQEAKSKGAFESVWLSEVGLKGAMAQLSAEEGLLLHLLKHRGEVVDVSFFKPLYHADDGQRWYNSYTQQYQKTFKAVRENLVRRGVLLMAEDGRASAGQTKMERWRFRLPSAFEKFLPPVFAQPKTFETPGNHNQTLAREKLLEIFGQNSAAIRLKGGQYRLSLNQGQLMSGAKPFQAAHLISWQQAEWATSLQKEHTHLSYSYDLRVGPLEAIAYGLGQLGPNQYASTADIGRLLKVFCYRGDTFEPGRVCQTGWQWGLLEKQSEGKQDFYRLAPKTAFSGSAIKPERYLQPKQKWGVGLNLNTIPWLSLEYFSLMADLEVIDAQLFAKPNLIKMGRGWEVLKTHPLTLWLEAEDPQFAMDIAKLKKVWGQTIFHRNLLVAQVKDLSLKVALQKTFSAPAEIVFLPNDYIAFPPKMARKIENLVNKNGHVVKRVNAA